MDAFQKISAIVIAVLLLMPAESFAGEQLHGGLSNDRRGDKLIDKEIQDFLEPAPDEPISAEPELVEPTPIEPASTEHDSADPAPDESASTRLEPVQPTPIGPASTKRDSAEPIPDESVLNEPKLVEPTPIVPAPTEQDPAKPTPVEPASTKPDDVSVSASEEVDGDTGIEANVGADKKALDDSFTDLADTFLMFRHKLSQAIDLPLETPADVQHLLSHMHVEDEERLIQSWFAYNALIVVETPTYVEGIESLLRKHTAEDILRRLQTEKHFARQISGAEDVLRRLRMERRDDNLRLQILTRSLLDISEAWKQREWGAIRGDSNIMMHALAHLRMFVAVAEKHVGAIHFTRDARAEVYTPTDLILTLGARRILGAHASEVNAIEYPEAFQCFRWARLNLDQCIASSYDPSEEAWCAGVHGVEDIAGCWHFLLPDESQ